MEQRRGRRARGAAPLALRGSSGRPPSLRRLVRARGVQALAGEAGVNDAAAPTVVLHHQRAPRGVPCVARVGVLQGSRVQPREVSPRPGLVLDEHALCGHRRLPARRHGLRPAGAGAVAARLLSEGALVASLDLRSKLGVVGYQVWLALAWKLGGQLGTRMTRAMARWLRCPTEPASITHKMNYPYAMQWFGTAGGFKGAAQIKLPMPLLFVYGERKPFMFHSSRWLEQVAATPGSAVQGLPCGHWVMVSRPEAFHARVREWLWGEV